MEIQYLIKFVSQKEHADMLLNGNLFMHSLGYYIELERCSKQPGQGDIREGSLSSTSAIYSGINYPIYCMTTIHDSDIKDNRIAISNRLIKDFNCEDGYAVLIKYEDFYKKLYKKLEYVDPKILRCNLVQYGPIPFELTKILLTSNRLDHLFIKHPFFSYQKEYRIVVLDPLPPRIEKGSYDGMEVDFIYYDASRTYQISGGLHDCATVYSIADLPNDSDNVFICL